MKRLLLLAYGFPPAPTAGSLRPGYLARYLPQFGWQVTVVTNSAGTPPFPVDVISSAPSGATFEDRMRMRLGRGPAAGRLRAAARRIKESLLFPDDAAPWIPKAVAMGLEAMQRDRFDAILSTAHPPSVHVAAWILSRKSGLPWICDYRDPWTGNVYARRSAPRRFMESLLERGIVHRAAAISTISQPISQHLARLHRRSDVAVIPNGYDPSEWSGIDRTMPSEFGLCYTGSMYDGKRSPELLFDALEALRSEGDPAGKHARVHFYGPNSEFVTGVAHEHGIGLLVRQHGPVSRAQAMLEQRRAAALLIFLNMDPKTASEMGSKYLEYVGAGRPIIVFGPQRSALGEFITKNRLGWFASNPDEAKDAVRAAYAQFLRGTPMPAAPAAVPTARDLAREFADLLDRHTNVATIRRTADCAAVKS